jgi:RND family efflux transporter MFP subunit
MRNLKVLLPVAALALSLVGAAILIATSSPVEGRPSQRKPRPVRVLEVQPLTVQLHVLSQGTVAPRTESQLIPEVSGRVVEVSPALVSGGYFEADEMLLRIDPHDYESALERARANVARAEGEYEHARQALERQEGLASRDVVSPAALDDAERAERVTGAALREERVKLAEAERDLARTEIRAPFAGRVREERVDVGQFLSRGQGFATLYATDFVEIRLPVPDHQLAYLDVPLWDRDGIAGELPAVTLSARFAGAVHSWQGQIVRTEGEIDPKSRMVHVVARVEAPYTPSPDSSRPPLAVGLFVQAEIEGRFADQVTVVPRSAMRNGSQLLIVDAENRLRYRNVEVLRIERGDVLIRSGLEAGERVCISQLQAVVEGMEVEPILEGVPGENDS